MRTWLTVPQIFKNSPSSTSNVKCQKITLNQYKQGTISTLPPVCSRREDYRQEGRQRLQQGVRAPSRGRKGQPKACLLARPGPSSGGYGPCQVCTPGISPAHSCLHSITSTFLQVLIASCWALHQPISPFHITAKVFFPKCKCDHVTLHCKTPDRLPNAWAQGKVQVWQDRSQEAFTS